MACLWHALSSTIFPMRLDINPRGNGACPLCTRDASCRLKRLLSSSVEAEADPSESGMEIVVYNCPYFAEKVRP